MKLVILEENVEDHGKPHCKTPNPLVPFGSNVPENPRTNRGFRLEKKERLLRNVPASHVQHPNIS